MEESIVANGLTGKSDVKNVEAPTNPKSKDLVLFSCNGSVESNKKY